MHIVQLNSLRFFTFGRKNLLRASFVDFPFADSGSFAEAFGSSFCVGFAALAAGSPLVSSLGGSGGGGGGAGIPLGAADCSDVCATYSKQKNDILMQR